MSSRTNSIGRSWLFLILLSGHRGESFKLGLRYMCIVFCVQLCNCKGACILCSRSNLSLFDNHLPRDRFRNKTTSQIMNYGIFLNYICSPQKGFFTLLMCNKCILKKMFNTLFLKIETLRQGRKPWSSGTLVLFSSLVLSWAFHIWVRISSR